MRTIAFEKLPRVPQSSEQQKPAMQNQPLKGKHHFAVTAPAPSNDAHEDSFLHAVGTYIRRHWAWAAIIALWWFSRTHPHLSYGAFAAVFLGAAVVVVLGWRQLTANSYWRGYFTILLVFAGFMVFVGGFPVLFLLFLVALIAMAIDLFFVAPHH